MKITTTPPVTSTATGRANTDKNDTAKPSQAAPAAAPMQSAGIRKALAESSEVDMNKVNQLRQAIAEGRVSLDPAALAEAVMDVHRK